MSDTHNEVMRLEALRKSYNVGLPNETEVLHGIDLQIGRRDFAALVGPSGSGKSTLLNLIGLLDTPSSGELYLLGQPTRAMDDAAPHGAARQAIGFVFQFHHLIPGLHRAGQRADAADGGAGQARLGGKAARARNCWQQWAGGRTHASPISSPAVSSSAWPSRAR
jgi:ABC-type branched-subunit amino acid transport system ATPase component